MRYLWTEDIGAGLHFWRLMNLLIFDGEFVVESKGSNQGYWTDCRRWRYRIVIGIISRLIM